MAASSEESKCPHLAKVAQAATDAEGKGETSTSEPQEQKGGVQGQGVYYGKLQNETEYNSYNYRQIHDIVDISNPYQQKLKEGVWGNVHDKLDFYFFCLITF